MALFTSETARQAQANGLQARLRNAIERKKQKLFIVKQTVINGETIETFNITRARIVERMIDKTLAQYANATQPRDQQALAMALDRLYGTWADLTGFERRGVSRGTKRRTSNPLSDLHESPPDQ